MLKKSLILGLVLILASYTYAKDLSKEEAAIKKAIEDETYYADQKNYNKFSDLWMHEPYVYWSVTNPNSHFELEGWEALSKYFKKQFEKFPEPMQRKANKTDYKFRIIEKMAFVTFREDGNASTRVMEKQNGKWKLIRMGVVGSTAYYTPYEKPPIPKGGFGALRRNLVYPQEARRQGIEGKVILQVLINESGKAEDARVIKSLGTECDIAAVNAAKKTKWEPAENKGKPVKVWIAIPMIFRLLW